MNNLFKKGFASLALVSAMASSIFAFGATDIGVKIDKGAFIVGKDSLIVQNFDEKNLKNALWIKVAVAASVAKDKGAIPNVHFYGLANKNKNLIHFKEIKGSGSGFGSHNMLVAIGFKINVDIPETIQNNGNMNIAIKMNHSSITEAHYLATNTKILKSFSLKHARISIINTNILFTTDPQAKDNTEWNKLVNVSLNHGDTIKAEPYKIKVDADEKFKLNPNSMIKNEATLNLQNKFGTPNMLKANVANNGVENNGTTAQILLNPNNAEKKFGKAMIHTNASKISLNPIKNTKSSEFYGQPLLKADTTNSGNFFGEHMLHADASKISLNPIKNTKSSEFYGQPLLKADARIGDKKYGGNISFAQILLAA